MNVGGVGIWEWGGVGILHGLYLWDFFYSLVVSSPLRYCPGAWAMTHVIFWCGGEGHVVWMLEWYVDGGGLLME